MITKCCRQWNSLIARPRAPKFSSDWEMLGVCEKLFIQGVQVKRGFRSDYGLQRGRDIFQSLARLAPEGGTCARGLPQRFVVWGTIISVVVQNISESGQPAAEI